MDSVPWAYPPGRHSPVLDWIGRHIGGWEIIAPFLLLAGIAGAFVLRSARRDLYPYTLVFPWALAVLAYYQRMGIDRLWYYARGQWGMTTLTLVIVLTIPFAALFGVFHLRALASQRPVAHGLLGAIAGVATIPLAGVVSNFLFILLHRT